MKMRFTKNFVPLPIPPRLRDEIYKERELFIKRNKGIDITKKKFIELKIVPLIEDAMKNRRGLIRNGPIKKAKFI